jgi:hypothetical protein
MESGFGQNLEGFLIKGNLSLIKGDIPAIQGDGSIEGSGSLYINSIREYDVGTGVSIQDVLFNNGTIVVPYTAPSYGPTSASFLIDGGLYIRATSNSTSLTSGGGLTVAGGVSIGKQLSVGGLLDVSGNRILNVSWPLNGTDGVPKDYVDSIVGSIGSMGLGGNVSVGQLALGGSGGSLISYQSLTYNNSTSTLNLIGSLNLTGGSLNLGNATINDLGRPVLGSDAATKDYVDGKTYGNLSGSFGQNQVVVGGTSGGNTLASYSSLKYDGNNLQLLNTSDAVGLGTGGTLTVSGGASFLKDVYIGGVLDTNMQNIKNVANPVDTYDAANKTYVDTALESAFNSLNSFGLANNQLIPSDIPNFTVPADTRAFIAYVYAQNGETCTIHMLRGINRGTNWYINRTLIGTPDSVEFYIRTATDGSGVVQYINKNTSGSVAITYSVVTSLLNDAHAKQVNVSVANLVDTLTPVSGVSFDNATVEAAKIIISVSNETNNEYSLYCLNCLQKGDGGWSMFTSSVGNISGLMFSLIETPLHASLGYINNNATGTYTLRIRSFLVDKTQPSLMLAANTIVPQDVSGTAFAFDNTQVNFQLTVSVSVPNTGMYALYDLEGINCEGNWALNSTYIGDRVGVMFSMKSNGNMGYLQYVNQNANDAYIRYLSRTPLLLEGVPVRRGGTGNTHIYPDAILRGNGIDPLVATSDFTYTNDTLQLTSSQSNITIANGASATSLTAGGTITSRGGASFGKNVYIGEQLNVKGVSICPNPDDILQERTFSAQQDITDDTVSGLQFNPNITKSFKGSMCITVQTVSSQMDALYDIYILKRSSGWMLAAQNIIGDPLNITFAIDSLGQVRYSAPSVAGWISTTMKFNGLTTSN